MLTRRTRIGRVLFLWGSVFLVTLILVSYPTRFAWPFWVYGLVWGMVTSAIHYAFRGHFEEEVEIRAENDLGGKRALHGRQNAGRPACK